MNLHIVITAHETPIQYANMIERYRVDVRYDLSDTIKLAGAGFETRDEAKIYARGLFDVLRTDVSVDVQYR